MLIKLFNSLYKNIFVFICLIFSLNVSAENHSSPKSIAFYYQHVDSVRELLVYDRVVLTPSAITSRQLKQLHKGEVETFAYLSVGELHGDKISEEFKQHIISHNHDWDSAIMDMASEFWKNYLLTKTSEYKTKGFTGLFLDTLDSYKIANTDTEFQKLQQQGLINALNELNQLIPNLILNRGFEIVSQLNFKPSGVVAESLFKGYNVAESSYYDTDPAGQAWLIDRLNEVRALNIEAIVIDYLDGNNRVEQRKAAKALLKHNFTPYISDGLLEQFGISTIEPIKRRVLTFYSNQDVLRHESNCSRILSTIIEYNGFVPECVAIEEANLNSIDTTRYQAIAFWLEPVSYNKEIFKWIDTWFGKTRLVLLDYLPQNSVFLSKLGIEQMGTELSGKLTIKQQNPALEKLLPFSNASLKHLPIYQVKNSTTKAQLTLEDEKGNTSVAVFTAPWGAVVLKPAVVQSLDLEKRYWTFEPFKFIDLIFQLPTVPVPDITTESGNRILTAHIDGDGFPSRAWMPNKPFSADVLLQRIFKKYTIPHTVSVIEAEISADGLHPENSAEMESIARETFRLPHVEIASHTYSHPFFWDDRVDLGEKQYGDTLPIPNYTVDYDKEIFGSVDYINDKLAPKDKKVKMLLWSGVADPTENIIEKTLKYGLLNVNGGSTFVVNGEDSIAQVFPHLMWHENAVQVYAPVINENLYTNLWTENYSGYARVIETFELLGYPKRLKTISIYYHMYSGVYPSSVEALEKIYDWVYTQESTPLYLSEYAERARTLYETGIGKPLNNEFDFLITSTGIKTLRLSEAFEHVDLSSTPVAGWNKGPDGRYVSLVKTRTPISFISNKPKLPYLNNVNGVVNKWKISQHSKKSQSIEMSVTTHMPLNLIISQGKQCKLVKSNTDFTVKVKGSSLSLTSPKAGKFTATLECNNG
ncbi:endo alpha-1,4 polygalactosaminidase [Pseudocolwellia sp. AS88]|uniref:endo alpha-1,4 polygalactosaminidase n=1 Tax=Pseudocolwellia sp. AS88 TaxID=3063958 RepID=UPI0026EB4742|nr:endo alpha-1,4 polygalactosaminidase [Pseudocolwellia sp. AS88]MDO7084907.1 endo alpha-1,4 polygalactosaminidase [Pseudocolwellia sp. AS88]